MKTKNGDPSLIYQRLVGILTLFRALLSLVVITLLFISLWIVIGQAQDVGPATIQTISQTIETVSTAEKSIEGKLSNLLKDLNSVINLLKGPQSISSIMEDALKSFWLPNVKKNIDKTIKLIGRGFNSAESALRYANLAETNLRKISVSIDKIVVASNTIQKNLPDLLDKWLVRLKQILIPFFVLVLNYVLLPALEKIRRGMLLLTSKSIVR